MQKKSGDFSVEEAMRLIDSPAGRQLITILQQSKDPELQKAMVQASKGNFAQAQQALNAVTASAEIKKILQQLEG